MKHELKCYPNNFQRIKSGEKNFDVRRNDRGYQAGDEVTLKEWDPDRLNPTDESPKGFTKETPLEFRIGFVERLSSDVILSLLPIKKGK